MCIINKNKHIRGVLNRFSERRIRWSIVCLHLHNPWYSDLITRVDSLWDLTHVLKMEGFVLVTGIAQDLYSTLNFWTC